MANCFIEGNTELLLCIRFLDPKNSFPSFDNSKLVRLIQFILSRRFFFNRPMVVVKSVGKFYL